jgi:hypothetical protein
MMRHFKLTAASLIAGAALTLSACGGGNSDANNTADANAMMGNDTNMVDPMAVETMNNGTDTNATGGTGSTGTTGGSTAGNSAGTAGTMGNSGATTGTGTGGTDAGGDTGGNAAGGTVNGM